MAKVDLKDAYTVVPPSSASSTSEIPVIYLEGSDILVHCLPFGLCCVPWVFTKVIKSVVAFLRERERERGRHALNNLP